MKLYIQILLLASLAFVALTLSENGSLNHANLKHHLSKQIIISKSKRQVKNVGLSNLALAPALHTGRFQRSQNANNNIDSRSFIPIAGIFDKLRTNDNRPPIRVRVGQVDSNQSPVAAPVDTPIIAEQVTPSLIAPVQQVAPVVAPVQQTAPVVAPVQQVAPRVVAPVQQIAPRVVAPVQQVAPRVFAPVQQVAPRVFAPVQQVAPRIVAPVQQVAPRVFAPVQQVAPRIVAPVQQIAPRVVAPFQQVSPRVVAPVQLVAPRVMAPVQQAVSRMQPVQRVNLRQPFSQNSARFTTVSQSRRTPMPNRPVFRSPAVQQRTFTSSRLQRPLPVQQRLSASGQALAPSSFFDFNNLKFSNVNGMTQQIRLPQARLITNQFQFAQPQKPQPTARINMFGRK